MRPAYRPLYARQGRFLPPTAPAPVSAGGGRFFVAALALRCAKSWRSPTRRCYATAVPVARSPADILCLALYTLAGGQVLRGYMVQTIANRLGVTFDQAEAMAVAADEAGLVRHQMHTVTLTGEGLARGAALTAPAGVKTSGRSRRSSTRPASRRATPRPPRR